MVAGRGTLPQPSRGTLPQPPRLPDRGGFPAWRRFGAPSTVRCHRWAMWPPAVYPGS